MLWQVTVYVELNKRHLFKTFSRDYQYDLGSSWIQGYRESEARHASLSTASSYSIPEALLGGYAVAV